MRLNESSFLRQGFCIHSREDTERERERQREGCSRGWPLRTPWKPGKEKGRGEAWGVERRGVGKKLLIHSG